MMKKLFCSMLAVLVFALGLPAQAQQSAKIPKIGWLGVRPAAPGTALELFMRELRVLGYVEGKNVVVEYRSADGKLDRLPALAEELVRLKVDVLLTPATSETLAAKNATKTIPIVFYSIADPIALGLVDSLARPGGNITGFTTISAELGGKRLELLKETVPNLSRVAVLLNPQAPSAALEWKENQLAATALKLQLYAMEVGSADKYESAFNAAIKARSNGLTVISSAFHYSNQKRITELAAKNRLPAIYPRADFVQGGGLMSYAADQTEPYKRVAVFVDKILKGTKPAEIPVEQPMRFEFIVNLIAAKQIGLTIPPNLLVRAQKVIR
jgi:putative ABC transport system substrate-binding protein